MEEKKNNIKNFFIILFSYLYIIGFAVFSAIGFGYVMSIVLGTTIFIGCLIWILLSVFAALIIIVLAVE